MIPQADILQTFAEISAALAGFAALAGVLAERLTPTSHGRSFARLRLVVVIAVLFLFLSLLPLVTFELGLPVTTSWRLCSGIAFVLNAFTVYSSIQASRRVGVRILERSFNALVWPLEVVCQLSLLANILLLAPELAGALYLVYLLAGVAQALVTFLLLLDEVFVTSER